MKSWLSLVVLAAGAAIVLAVRRAGRQTIVTWWAARLGPDARSARRAALVRNLVALLAATAVLVGAWTASRAGDPGRWLGAAAAVLVLVTYVPFTSVGAPRMTRWQKSFGQHLAEAGAARSAADACAGVARVFSGVGVLVTLAALIVVAHHAA